MRRTVVRGVAVWVALGATLVACGSSKKASPAPAATGGGAATSAAPGASTGPSGSGGSSGGAKRTVTVGVITSLTGNASSGFLTTEKGIKARLDAQNAAGGVNGTTVKYVIADDQSTPTGALAAAKKLVESDHVAAVLPVTSDFFAAAPYLKAQHIPVTGGSFDGTEWIVRSNTNLFPADGSVDYNKSATTMGTFMKSQGVTKFATLAYGVSASSVGASKAAVTSMQHAGIGIAYQNLTFPFGSTDVGPVAIAIKNSGADGLYTPTVPSTAFALAGALQQMGVKLKAVVLATGYGGDLLGVPAAVQAAQGYIFAVTVTPSEVKTPATTTLTHNLATYAGVTGTPTFAEQQGYLSADLYLYGLQQNNGNPDASSYISALRKSSTWNASGLYTKPVDFSQYGVIGSSLGPGSCINMVRLSGKTFVPIAGAVPVCGTLLP